MGESASRDDVEGLMRGYSHWVKCGLIASTSANGVGDQPDLGDYLDQLSDADFIWVIVANPVSAERSEEAIRQQQSVIQALQPRAERASEKLELERGTARLRELGDGRATGLWQVMVLAGAQHAADARRAAGVLCAGSGAIAGRYNLRPLPGTSGFDEALNGTRSTDEPIAPFIVGTNPLVDLSRPPARELAGFRLRARHTFDMTPEVGLNGIGGPRFLLGQILDQVGRPAGRFEVRSSTLLRHAFVCGATGSGKSQTVRNLLEQLSGAQPPIPWLVIEPSKSEYRRMAGRLAPGIRLVSIRPGAAEVVPLTLNPLEPEPGFRLQAHIDLVKALFLAAFQAQEPFPQVLSHALSMSYTRLNWNLATGVHHGGPPAYPTLGDLQECAMDVVEDIKYGTEVAANVRGFVDVRIGSLRLGTPGRFFEGGHPLDISKLLSQNVVLEIEDLGNDQDKAFVIGAILIRVVEHLRVQAQADQTYGSRLRHVIVLEEAHRLLRRATDSLSVTAVELFASLLSEIRAYGEGIIVVEQIPAKILPDVVKNSALKIVHRLPARDDRDLVGATMNLDDRQSDFVVSLEPGHAAVFADGMDRPVLVRVPLGEDRERAVASDSDRLITDGRRRYAGCSERCHGAEPCTGVQLEESRAVAANAQLTLWVELAVVAHVVGREMPLPEVVWTRGIRAQNPVDAVLECAVAHAVEVAVQARSQQLLPLYDPRSLAAHVAAAMRAVLWDRVDGRCLGGEWRFQAGPYRWQDVSRQLTEAVMRGTSGRHPDSASWEARGLGLPGTTCRQQLMELEAFGLGPMPWQTLVFGSTRPSRTEAAVGCPRDAPEWAARLAARSEFLRSDGGWHLRVGLPRPAPPEPAIPA
jgi:hypothetical protein